MSQPDGLGHLFAHLIDLHADASSRHATVGAKLVRHAYRLVDGDGKRNALKTTRARIDLAVDANHLAAHVDQRSAGIARVDRHVGLNERKKITRVALLRADDARRDGVFQTKR
ncbi:hypothetical protein D9M68_793510 [compost metagenome]